MRASVLRHLVASQRNRHFGGLPGIPSSWLPAHSQLTAEQPALLPHSSYAEIERNAKAKMGREKLSHEQREIHSDLLRITSMWYKPPLIHKLKMTKDSIQGHSTIPSQSLIQDLPVQDGDPQKTHQKRALEQSLTKIMVIWMIGYLGW